MYSVVPKPTMTLPERDKLYLHDMLSYAKKAVKYAAETSLEKLYEDHKTSLAMERAVEIIGEAAKTVSSETQKELPQIPWRDMARTRDFFAHHYFKIDI